MIANSLQQGFQSFEHYYQQPDNSQPMSRFFSSLTIHSQQHEAYIAGKMDFKAQQNNLYHIMYSNSVALTTPQKLFCEFLIGLCRFKFCLIMTLEFITFSQEKIQSSILISKTDTPLCSCEYCQINHPFWEDFHTLSYQVISSLSRLIKVTNQFENDSFWTLASAFFNNNPIYKKLAGQLVSIQYIPENETQMLSIAQTLHWGGFGGDGHIIKNITQLKPLLPHCIGYHGKESGGFNARLKTILTQQQSLKTSLIRQLSSLLPAFFNCGSEVNILDLGSGPKHLGANPIIQQLINMNCKPSLTATDMDPNSLQSLLELQSESPVLQQVRYLDLTQLKKNHLLLPQPYHIVTASLVLHQLSFQQIAESFEFLLNHIIHEGLIINCDVASSGWYQCLLVPSNETDREGYVPTYNDKHFTLPILFNEDSAKVAYPIKDLTQYFPSQQIPLYAINIYLIITLPTSDATKLKVHWDNKEYTQADRLASTHSKKFSDYLSYQSKASS